MAVTPGALAWLALVCGAAPAPGRLSDDFTTDSRKGYVVEGKVTWRKGDRSRYAALQRDVALARRDQRQSAGVDHRALGSDERERTFDQAGTVDPGRAVPDTTERS